MGIMERTSVEPGNNISVTDTYSNASVLDTFSNTTEMLCASDNFVPNIGSAIAYITIAFVGISGNLLVIVVILKKSTMTKWCMNILIINQSALDLFSSVVMMSIAVKPMRPQRRYFEGFVDEVLCRVWYSANPLWGALIASSYNLIAIAVERYTAVLFPVVYRNVCTQRRVKLACLVPWGVFLVILLNGTRLHAGRCCLSAVSYTSDAEVLAHGLLATFFIYVLPTFVFLFCYTSMYRSLNRTVTPLDVGQLSSQAAQRENRHRRMRRNIFKTQVIVVASFITCWSLNQTLFLAFNLGLNIDFFGPLFHVSVVSVFANSCVNPFIYAFKYQMFQRGLRQLFCNVSETAYTEEGNCGGRSGVTGGGPSASNVASVNNQ